MKNMYLLPYIENNRAGRARKKKGQWDYLYCTGTYLTYNSNFVKHYPQHL